MEYDDHPYMQQDEWDWWAQRFFKDFGKMCRKEMTDMGAEKQFQEGLAELKDELKFNNAVNKSFSSHLDLERQYANIIISSMAFGYELNLDIGGRICKILKESKNGQKA